MGKSSVPVTATAIRPEITTPDSVETRRDHGGGRERRTSIEDTTTGRPTTARGSSTADLVKHLSEQIGKLAREEVQLAQLELIRMGKRVGLGIGMFSGGGLLALYGLACLVAAAVIGLATAVAAWLAALIIGAGLLAVAGVAALAGRAELRKAPTPGPDRAVNGVRADIKEIKESARR